MFVLLGLLIIPGCFAQDSFVCHPNCVLNGKEYCNSTNGECLYGCQPGYAGLNCSVECPQTCASSNTSGTEICNASSEECLFGCQDGYYGSRCENMCNVTVEYCKKCSLQSDNSVICDECIRNFYDDYGKCRACNYFCALNMSSPLPVCRENDGYCNFGCQAGRYGFICGLQCSSICKDTCDRVNGTCLTGCRNPGYCGRTCQLICNDGCSSQDCEQSCSCRLGCIRNRWGDQCDKVCNVNCNEPPDLNSNKCERSNGSCLYNCINETYWGSQCEKKCSSKCIGGICDQVTGNCTLGCTSKEVYGIGCDKACNENCVNDTCERSDGFCDSGCVTGRYGDRCHLNCRETCLNLRCHRTSAYCEDGCVEGNFGDQCEKQCSLTCLKRSCDRNTGNCENCKSGYYGPQCQEVSFVCHPNCMLPVVNGTEHCNFTTGHCLYGCQPGFAGLNCSVKCPNTCASSNVRGTQFCNATSEECLFGCQDGYYGARCENKCDDIIQTCKKCSLQSNNSVICDECMNNFYRDNGKCTSCNDWCIHNASSPLPACREADGYCNFGCKTGHYGSRCGQQCSTCKDVCDRQLENTSVDRKLVVGLVCGWLLSLVLFASLVVILLRKYHMCRVCSHKKKGKDLNTETVEHEDRVQHTYMSLQHESGFTNRVGSFETLDPVEGDKDVQQMQSNNESVEEPAVNHPE